MRHNYWLAGGGNGIVEQALGDGGVVRVFGGAQWFHGERERRQWRGIKQARECERRHTASQIMGASALW